MTRICSLLALLALLAFATPADASTKIDYGADLAQGVEEARRASRRARS